MTLMEATLLYAIVMRNPFCLCKHILHTMLEVRDEKNTSLTFGCLITQIYLQVVPDISDLEPRSPDLPPAAASSSSQAMPPSFDIEAAFTQLMTSMSAL